MSESLELGRPQISRSRGKRLAQGLTGMRQERRLQFRASHLVSSRHLAGCFSSSRTFGLACLASNRDFRRPGCSRDGRQGSLHAMADGCTAPGKGRQPSSAGVELTAAAISRHAFYEEDLHDLS